MTDSIRNLRTTYKIEITALRSWQAEEKVRFLIEEKPSDKTKKTGYSGEPEVILEKKYEVKDDWVDKKSESQIYKQEVESLDLAKVILAINEDPDTELNKTKLAMGVVS